MHREKKSLEDKVVEYSTSLAEEEDKVKQLAKAKAKQEAIIADYEEQMNRGEKVKKINYLLLVLGQLTM